MLVTENKRTAPTLIPENSVFGRLTATSEYEMRQRPDGRNRAYQRFNCECGNSIFLVGYSVKNGNTSSCGCLHNEQLSTMMKTHGLSKTSAYRVALNKSRRLQKKAYIAGVEVNAVTSAQLSEQLIKFDNSCWICEVELTEVCWDHVQPLSKGGAHTLENLKPACRNCNSRKSVSWPFTDEMKNAIAEAVRASRTPQVLPVQDGEEVLDVCHP